MLPSKMGEAAASHLCGKAERVEQSCDVRQHFKCADYGVRILTK